MRLKEISYDNYNRRLQRLERKNLETCGSSTSWVSIGNHASNFRGIKECKMDSETLIIDEDAFKQLRDKFKRY